NTVLGQWGAADDGSLFSLLRPSRPQLACRGHVLHGGSPEQEVLTTKKRFDTCGHQSGPGRVLLVVAPRCGLLRSTQHYAVYRSKQNNMKVEIAYLIASSCSCESMTGHVTTDSGDVHKGDDHIGRQDT
ncbi:hypothetical protein CEXT_261791, partial [Caerostris extrusa]